MNDSQIQSQAYSYFLVEAPELLQTIEQEILTLPSEHTTAKVHNLMRALHTLKGAAANVGLKTIEQISHSFEDLVRVFYDLELDLDPSIQILLLDGYSALNECLDAQINARSIDEQAILKRMEETLEQLKLKLGDWSQADIALPTAIELGFDIVASIFETTIQEHIDEIVTVIATHDLGKIEECLLRLTDIGISLAESFELPGFLAIERAIIVAISHHPDRLEEIALLALINLQQAQTDVLAGDRLVGGTILPDLDRMANLAIETQIPQIDEFDELEIVTSTEGELTAFQAFLTSDKFRKRYELSSDTKYLFDRIIRLCWDWFRHEIQASDAQLNLEILVITEGLVDLDYIHHWVKLLLQGLTTPGERASLYLYRECCIYQVVFAVAKYLAGTETHPQFTPELLTELRSHLHNTVNTYKQGSPVTANERGWLDRIILPHHWTKIPVVTTGEDLLLDEIWGQLDFGVGELVLSEVVGDSLP